MANPMQYAGIMWAVYSPDGRRIVHFSQHPPEPGPMIDHWFRDNGEEYLGAIMDRWQATLNPKLVTFTVHGREVTEAVPI